MEENDLAWEKNKTLLSPYSKRKKLAFILKFLHLNI